LDVLEASAFDHPPKLTVFIDPGRSDPGMNSSRQPGDEWNAVSIDWTGFQSVSLEDEPFVGYRKY
jgi:hypothetical protein